jgi:hypothetical protein
MAEEFAEAYESLSLEAIVTRPSRRAVPEIHNVDRVQQIQKCENGYLYTLCFFAHAGVTYVGDIQGL